MNENITQIDPAVDPTSTFPDSTIARIVDSARAINAHDCILRENGDGWCVIDGKVHFFERNGEPRRFPFQASHIQEMLQYIYKDLPTIMRATNGAATVRVPLRSGPTRVQIARDIQGYSLTFRLLPTRPLTPKMVGAPPWLMDFFANAHRGLIVICGDVGNGKSTLWQMIVEHLYAKQMRQIITLESPVEVACENPLIRQYDIELDGQPEPSDDPEQQEDNINDDKRVLYGFNAGLRHRLRCNANVLVLGEVLDAETVVALLAAAESGALVIVTIHSLRTVDVIDRLLSMLPSERARLAQIQLAETLVGVIGTRLIPKNGGGRVLGLEILRNTRTVKDMIRKGDTNRIYQDIETNGNDPDNGHLRLENMLRNLIHDGIITTEEAQKSANNPEVL